MNQKQTYMCPICGYPGLDEPPYDEYGCASFDICPCCGVEYGYHDCTTPHVELRQRWIALGMPWSHPPSPSGWDPEKQLRDADMDRQ